MDLLIVFYVAIAFILAILIKAIEFKIVKARLYPFYPYYIWKFWLYPDLMEWEKDSPERVKLKALEDRFNRRF